MKWAPALCLVFVAVAGAAPPIGGPAVGGPAGISVPIVRPKDPAARIDALVLEPLAGLRERQQKVYVVFRGSLRRTGNLSVGGAPVKPGATGAFLIGIPQPDIVKGKKQYPVVWELREGTRVMRETIWIELPTVSTEPPKPKLDFWSVGLQFSYLSYAESDQAPYSALALTGKINFIHKFRDSEWEIGGSAYGTILPFSKSRSEDARFLGVNFRGGARVNWIPAPWSLRLLAGGYYTRMLVTNSEFGFQDMWGPQLFPVLARATSPRNAISFYGKFSPVAAGGTLSFTSYEVALGGGFTWVLGPQTRLDFIVDFAFMNINALGSSATARSLSGGFSFGF